jgi:hypothetical protein
LQGLRLKNTSEEGRSLRPEVKTSLTPANDGANLLVCPNLTASERSNAGGTMEIRAQEHRFACSRGSLGEQRGPTHMPTIPGSGQLKPPLNPQLSAILPLLVLKFQIRLHKKDGDKPGKRDKVIQASKVK